MGTRHTRYVLVGVGAASAVGLGVAMLVPPRVLLVGDSITGQYAPAAAAELRDRGYDPVVRAYPGVGLLDRSPRIDAPALIRADLAKTTPSSVVAEFSGDYGIADPPLPGVPLGSHAFVSAWKAQADALTHEVRGRGASLLWLLAPPPVRGSTGTDMGLAALYEQERRPGVGVVDPAPVFARYEVNGDLHAPDGRHVSAAGSALVARLVAERVGAQPPWRLRLRTLSRSPLAVAPAAAALLGLVAAISHRPRSRNMAPRRSSVPITP